ncbi:MAG: hypothetical protein JSR47_05565 [Proteobacteria bacterium]|nr:hypothetical protein [Pseudomonadota bacterium]
MLSTSDIARGVSGALKFLQRDPGAPHYFENSIEACVASFKVMALAAPVYGLYLLLYYARVDTVADLPEILLVETLHFVVDWLLFPVLFYEIARRRRWLGNYPRYIAALNWINLPVMVLAVIALGVSMLAPRPIGELIGAATQFLFYYWFVMATRLSLGTGWLLSFLLLIVNWMPSLLLSLIVDRLLGVVALPGV